MMLMVDVSSSQMFGSTISTKQNILTEIAAVLAFSAAQTGDKVGCILFSDRVERFIPPKKGRSHILMIIRSLLEYRPERSGTQISEAVRYMTNVNKKRCTAFLLSDFINPRRDMEPLSDALKIAASRHDIVAVRVTDRREAELPDVGIVEMQDAETHRQVWVDTSSKRVREAYAADVNQQRETIAELLRHNRVDMAEVTTDSDYVKELIKLFKKR